MKNLNKNTGLVIHTTSTDILDSDILNVVNNLRTRCLIHTNRVNHLPGTIDPQVKILSGTVTDESEMINMGITHFPKGVKRVLLYNLETSNINKRSFPTFDPKSFNAEYYMTTYPDIVLAGYNTPQLAFQHYEMFGFSEGRTSKPTPPAKTIPPKVWIYFSDEN